MKTNYTPGPWHTEGDTDVLSDDGAFVANTHDTRSDVGTAEEYANARLIAAAPKLAEALGRIIADLPSNRDWLDPVLESLAKEALKDAGVKL